MSGSPSASERPPEFDCGRTARPLRIAVVYNRWPVPMTRADQMTVAHLLSFLHARGHKTDVFTLETGADASQADRDWLRDHCENAFTFKHGRARMAFSLLTGVIRGLPLQVALYRNPRLKSELHTRIAAQEYDVVYVYYFRSAEAGRNTGRDMPNGRSGSSITTYLALQLSQSLNTRRIRDNAPGLHFRLLYEVESRLVARYETRIWRDFTKSIVIGPEDLATIEAECDRLGRPRISNSIFGAHGTNVERFTPRPDIPVVPNRVIFAGVMATPTNVQAVQWFASEVWPLVRSEVPEATFQIVGRRPDAAVSALASAENGIEVTGEVDEPAEYLAAAQVCVNPMQAGGGMQNKLIEYLASEKAIVATSVANEGIQAPREALVVVDAPEDFAAAVVELLRDPERAAALAASGRRFVLENWTWESHFLKLEAEFESAAAPAGS